MSLYATSDPPAPRHWTVRVLVTAAMVIGGCAVYLVNFYYDPLLAGIRPLWSFLWLVWPAGIVALGVIAWKVTLLPYRDGTPTPTEAWAFTEMRHPRLPNMPLYLRTRSRAP